LFVLQKTIPPGIFRPASGYDNEEILVWKTGFWEDLFVPLLKDYFLLKTIREKWLSPVCLDKHADLFSLEKRFFYRRFVMAFLYLLSRPLYRISLAEGIWWGSHRPSVFVEFPPICVLIMVPGPLPANYASGSTGWE
jgi:hypothetical protein